MVILKDIPLDLEFRKIKGRLHTVGEKGLVKAHSLLEMAKPLISARALYKVCFIEERPGDALVIDGADILDKAGRNGLLRLLLAADRPSLVCMTMATSEDMPDLRGNEIGHSYWIENSRTEAE